MLPGWWHAAFTHGRGKGIEGMAERTVRFGEEQIVYCLERKTVKNINLRVRRDGVVAVSAGAWVPAERIDAFVVSKGERILAALRHFEEVASLAPQPNHYDDGETFYLLGQALRLQVTRAAQEGVEADGALLRLSVRNEADEAGKRRLLEHYFDRACWTVFNEVMEEALPPFYACGVPTPCLRVRKMKSRWGSCMAGEGIITLNKRLLCAPRGCIAYVVTHELCHLIHPNHSKAFYRLLEAMMPDWKERREALERSAARL